MTCEYGPPSWVSVACLCALALWGCGEESTTADTFTPDAGTEADATAMDMGTEADTSAPPNPCLEKLTMGPTFDVHPDGPSTQIHADVVFDGEGVWVVYNVPDAGGTSNLTIEALRLGCDGQILQGPLKLSTDTSVNYIDPSAAWGAGGGLLTVWQGDNGQQPRNLNVYARRIDDSGALVGDQESRVEFSVDGAALDANAWMTRVAATPSGGFVMVGSRGSEAAMRFQVFAQRLDALGAPEGDAPDAFFESEVSQLEPQVAVDARGDAWLAWARGDDEPEIAQTRWATGDDGPEAAIAASVTKPAAGVSLAANGQRVAMAFGGEVGGDAQIVVMDAARQEPSAAALTLGEIGRVDQGPRVAMASETEGAVAWYRVVRGFRNEVHFARLTFGDDAPQSAGEEPISTVGLAAPYQPALTHVGQGVYLLVWSEGENPDFRMKGRFLSP